MHYDNVTRRNGGMQGISYSGRRKVPKSLLQGPRAPLTEVVDDWGIGKFDVEHSSNL